jgi:hypothetical protein
VLSASASASARAHDLIDQGDPIEAACRIVVLEDRLEKARRPRRPA